MISLNAALPTPRYPHSSRNRHYYHYTQPYPYHTFLKKHTHPKIKSVQPSSITPKTTPVKSETAILIPISNQSPSVEELMEKYSISEKITNIDYIATEHHYCPQTLENEYIDCTDEKMLEFDQEIAKALTLNGF